MSVCVLCQYVYVYIYILYKCVYACVKMYECKVCVFYVCMCVCVCVYELNSTMNKRENTLLAHV